MSGSAAMLEYAGAMPGKSARRPYRQVERAQAQQRTRESLLEVAAEEFFAGRWQSASLESLASAAGVTKQTLLRHFGSKDGLLLAALVHSGSHVFEQRFSVDPGNPASAVDNLLDHYEEWGERSLRVGTWQGGPPALAQFSRLARKVHYDWVELAFGPWLARLEGAARERLRASLIAVCDVQVWWVLAHDLGLPREQVRAVLLGLIEPQL
jgi:AcrR family transcriptional regulator